MWHKLQLTKRCLFSAIGLLLLSSAAEASTRAADTAAAIRTASFDASRCYRVRDFSLIRDDVKIFLTDGYLILSTPVGGGPIAAFFSAEVEGGDGEVLLVPPDAGERMSLAHYTQTPTLNEHFKGVLLLFTDGTGRELEEMLADRQSKPVAEMGALLTSQWTPTLRSLTNSFETRLVEDVAGGLAPGNGLFFAAMANTRLGNFDVIYDTEAREEITVGHLTSRDNRSYYDIWTSFPSRKSRQGAAKPSELDFVVQHVSIDAALDANLHLRTKTKLRILMPEPSARRRSGTFLAMDISRRMRVREAKIDGRAAEVFQRESLRSTLLRGSDNEAFLIGAEEPLTAGLHEVEIEHEGDVVFAAGNGVFAVSARGTWYPHHGTQFATYDIRFRHARALTVVASGEALGDRPTDDPAIILSEFRSTVPLRFVGFNVGEYTRSTVQRAGLRVDVYANKAVESALAPRRQEMILTQPMGGSPRSPGRPTNTPTVLPPPPPPPSPAQAIERLAGEISEAYEFLAAKLGPPPLKTLAVSPIPGAFGQGFPGLIYLSTLSYLDPRDRPAFANDAYQRVFFSDILVAHEVAHQWWGNQVASSGYHEEWMMEALANYSALMLVEKHKGMKGVDQILDFYRQHLLAKTTEGKSIDSVGPIRMGLRLETSEAPQAWRTITYEKGTWILHMLRRRLGDAGWLQLLRSIASSYREQRLSATRFLGEASRLLPKGDPDPKLENFASTWISGTGIPTLKLVPGKVPGQGSILQSEVDEEFSVDVPIEFIYPGGKKETRWVRTDGANTPFQFRLPAVPVRVTLDPSNSVLAVKGR